MDKLLPCPFCGASDGFVERIDLGSCAVICNQCGARGPDSCPEDDEDLRIEEENDWEPGEAAARRLWNTRHTSEGWQLVPKEQTLEMQHAYFAVVDRNMQRMQTDCRYGRYANASVAYREMLAVAPKPEAGS